MSISAPSQIGQYGANAAALYKREVWETPNLPRPIAHAVARARDMQYTPDFTKSGSSDDLFAYARKFDTNDTDSFTRTEIEEATGLDLNKALKGHPEDIIDLWDLNHDHKVDTQELATGILSIDGALGAPDGTITLAKRQATEKNLALAAQELQKQRARLAEAGQPPSNASPLSLDEALAHAASLGDLTAEQMTANPFLLSPPVTAGETFNDPFHLLHADAAHGNVLVNAVPGLHAGLHQIMNQGLVGQNVAHTFQQQNQAAIQRSIDATHEAFRHPLRDIADTVNLQEKYNAFKSAQ